MIGAAERRFQIDPLVIAEALAEFPHDRDVGAGKPVDCLPIVADRSRRGYEVIESYKASMASSAPNKLSKVTKYHTFTELMATAKSALVARGSK